MKIRCKHSNLRRVRNVRAYIDREGRLSSTIQIQDDGVHVMVNNLNILSYEELVYCKECEFVVERRR